MNNHITPAAQAIIDRLNEYVERKHAEHPDIPRERYWAALEAELKDIIKNRTEG